jgi:DNA (cytosine-5)-methyltransferase 1
MIAVKQKISIEEFDGKKYQIKIIEPYDKALITHYLHNYYNGISKHYKEDAEKVLNNFVEYKKIEENISIVAEDALQQLLFEVENAPFPTPENYFQFKFVT